MLRHNGSKRRPYNDYTRPVVARSCTTPWERLSIDCLNLSLYLPVAALIIETTMCGLWLIIAPPRAPPALVCKYTAKRAVSDSVADDSDAKEIIGI